MKKVKRHSKRFTQEQLAPCTTTDKNRQRVSTKVVQAVSQPYFYLAKGGQCYAFKSLDGKYVLKFFNEKKLTSKHYLEYFPDFFLIKKLRKKKAKKIAKRNQLLMQSQYLARGDLAEETGVLYAHLEKSKFPGKVQLLDKKGNLLWIELDAVKFVVQLKAEPVKKTIVALMYRGNVKECKKRILSIFDLLNNCMKKKIWDRDKALIRNDNIGFLEDRAIYVDTGKFSPFMEKRPGYYANYDLKRLKPLEKWLRLNYPVLAKSFAKQAREYIENSKKSPE